MDTPRKDWWHFRNEDLLALAENKGPLYVYNEETLNDIFFDLLAIDTLAGLFYPFHINFNVKILQKAFEIGADLQCNSLSEVLLLKEQFPKLPRGRIFFPGDHARDHEAHIPFRDLNKTLAACKTLYRHCPTVSILTLDNDVSTKLNRYVNKMDIPEIENYLEAIQTTCPQFALRLELPVHLMSYAGVLLVEALESGMVGGMHYIRIRIPINDVLHDEIHETGHQVVNLSRLHYEKNVMTRIARCPKHTGDDTVYVKYPCSMKKGDILLLTHMGTYSPGTQVDVNGRNGVTERYLNARTLCRVKL